MRLSSKGYETINFDNEKIINAENNTAVHYTSPSVTFKIFHSVRNKGLWKNYDEKIRNFLKEKSHQQLVSQK